MNIYKSYSKDQLEELFSNYLVNSWSYSKVTQFARNEKAFEMGYIYGLFGRDSATTVAGSAYHSALQYYFEKVKERITPDIVELETIAFTYIDDIEANKWKIQKTTPTVEECKAKATATASALLKNFFSEISTYDFDEILDVEIYGSEFVSVNGVDVPLPCNFRIDMVGRKDGKVIIVDHKSKAIYTGDEEAALTIGIQAITYVIGYESKTGVKVDEVWFVENKHSKNKDASAQLKTIKVEITDDTRRLYEALLYEPLRRMLEAVSNPDYIYLINDSDNYADKAELYDFWARTMICEVEDFNVEESKKELVSKRLKKIRDSSSAMITPKIIQTFKENAASFIQYDLSSKDMTREQKVEHVLRSFGILVNVAHVFNGCSSSTFLLEMSAGMKINSIYSHRLDIANALNVSNVRIGKSLTVYEGKSYLPIDFEKPQDKILYFDPAALFGRRIPLGKDNFENVVYWDLDNPSTPHALICGATGSGKSVCIKSIIEYARLAGICNIVIFDPKFEFTQYDNSYNDILDIENKMEELVARMNELVRTGEKETTLVIFDEFADAVANSRKGGDLKVYENVVSGLYKNGMPKMKRECTGEIKSLEENLRILLQKGRSSGFRIVAATQRASVKVITGDAKVNFPVQICFKVPKETDSRVVLDEPGAESLAGRGDGLIKSPEYGDTVRFQSYYYDPVMLASYDESVNATIIQ